MAEESKKDKNKPSTDVLADSKNWEQRVLSEMESPHLWNKTWAPLFDNDVPFEYDAKIKYLEKELQKFDNTKLIKPPKYGVAEPLKEIAPKDHRRKKMFYEDLGN